MRDALALLLVLLAVTACGHDEGDPNATDRRVIVLGVDGMDPAYLRERMDAGDMPNFKRLAEQGTFRALGTSMPPQSPVAWSDFITGTNAGTHGVFDFLRHDPETFEIGQGMSKTTDIETVVGIPIGGGERVNLRQGRAFWEYLEDRRIPATVFRVPVNFPPVGKSTRSFSGMGTPDLSGGDGAFTFWTSDPEVESHYDSGAIERVVLENGRATGQLVGPVDAFESTDKKVVYVKLDTTIWVDERAKMARIDVGDEKVLLRVGEWSDWVRLTFPLMKPVIDTTGIVRFYLKSVTPHLQVYATPVHMDPANPLSPVSSPDDAAAEVQKAVGDYATKGMPLETNGRRADVISDEAFIAHGLLTIRERERLLEHELGRFRDKSGFLFFYVSAVDLSNHIIWRGSDPEHPNYPKDASDAMRGARKLFYTEADRLLGKVMAEVDDRTTLIVMSDHGFAPYYRTVNLNNWLVKERYLQVFRRSRLKDIRLSDTESIDWLRTKAYAVGFNGIYLNLERRRKTGIVSDDERDRVRDEIKRKLLARVDRKTGKKVVERVYTAEEIYAGPFVKDAPDLVVGYARGYRASDHTALGQFGPRLIEDNMDGWSGDHMMAAELVPGVFLSNRKMDVSDPRLVDLPVTILGRFGIAKPEPMIGRDLIKNP